MKKSWGLTEKILTGEKKVESRWYKAKRIPWDKIKPKDTIYFKDSGELIRMKAKVTKVLQFDNLNSIKIKQILADYGKVDLGISHIMPEIKRYVAGKNYCILIFFDKVERVKAFDINKTGFGAMSAWIAVNNINQIKIS
ncbi:MAG: hypothetical protein Q8P63_02220 [Candidatus Nealsonbacteria bacterium]|nr:hypothetical protein [Candidatus Nealsonbacteria bacterium]